MAVYNYRGRDRLGKLSTGKIEAASIIAAGKKKKGLKTLLYKQLTLPNKG